jgi:hypothetical protein
MNHTYTIHQSRLPSMRELIAKLAKKAVKLGVPAPEIISVSEPYKKQQLRVYHEKGTSYALDKHMTVYFPAVDVEVAAADMVIGGWLVAAKLEVHDRDNNIVRALVDDLPQTYRHSGMHCEHCNTKRQRKEAWVLRSTENGRHMQVGSSCLSDFTRSDIGDDILNGMLFATVLFDTIKDFADDEEGGGGVFWIERDPLLAIAARAVREFGYVSKKDADGITNMSTAESAVNAYCLGHHFKGHQFAPLEADIKTAQAALAWLSEQVVDSDYLHNMKLIMANELVEPKNAGYAVSLIPAYLKATSTSKQGWPEGIKVKQRLTLRLKHVKTVTLLPNQWGSQFIHVLNDSDGFVYTWKTGSLFFEPGEDGFVNIKATVKELDDGKYGKQTVLTRCVLV